MNAAELAHAISETKAELKATLREVGDAEKEIRRRSFNLDEVAYMLGLHVQTVRVLAKEGRIRTVKVGKRWLVPTEAIDDFLGNRDA